MLHRPDWKQHFDVLDLDEDLWDELDRVRFWSELNDACDTLIELYEEEWLGPECLRDALRIIERFIEHARADSGTVLQKRAVTFLRALAALARIAERRGVPLLFSF